MIINMFGMKLLRITRMDTNTPSFIITHKYFIQNV